VRAFDGARLSSAELGQLLWAAQGITGPAGRRTAPSAGALYPLEVYAVLETGVYHYEPETHRLTLIHDADASADLYTAALEQEALLEAPVILALAAVDGRMEGKYGPERSPRYIYMEAGHAAQNVQLQAAVLNLGSVLIGAFSDEEVRAALRLPQDYHPLYLIPCGHPR
jgi:SagB-type dehydrogenase family enzyme